MPYNITWETNGVIKKFYGHVTADEFHQSINDLHSNENIDHVQYTINDFLEVTDFTISEIEVMAFADFAKGALILNPDILIAIVTKHENIITLAKTAATVFSERQMAIFSTIPETRAWLSRLS